LAIVEQAAKPPKRRALLVSINGYPDPTHKLNGCVNDVYSVSALLQENGFLPEDITA
jgi:metacaspase-1